MYVYYDRIADMISLQSDEEVIFLGGLTHSQLKLREYGYTPAQSRAAVLRAFFNSGNAVDLDNIKRMCPN